MSHEFLVFGKGERQFTEVGKEGDEDSFTDVGTGYSRRGVMVGKRRRRGGGDGLFCSLRKLSLTGRVRVGLDISVLKVTCCLLIWI